MLHGRYAHSPCRLVTHSAKSGDFGFNLVEARADGREQPLAGLGEADTARRSGEQAQAEFPFKGSDRVAERGLRYAQLCGRLGEALLAGNSDKGQIIVHVVAAHSSIHFLSPCE